MSESDDRMKFFKRLRRAFLWLVGIAALGLLSVSDSAWPQGGAVDLIGRNLGMLLLLVCALGRLWASLYIAGFKNEKLITFGPYSLVRNPLYVFSCCGVLGLGLVTGSLIITALLIVPFLVWFGLMVVEEERVLAGRYPDEWAAYAASTPRFIPAIRSPVVPESYTINARRVGSAFTDAIWFPVAGLIIDGIGSLHAAGVLPTKWFLY